MAADAEPAARSLVRRFVAAARRARAALLALAGLPIAVAATAAALGAWQLNAPLRLPEQGLRVELRKGDTLLGDLLPELRRQGALPNPHWLSWYARLSGADARLKAGAYQLEAGASALDMLERMVRGDAIFLKVTLREGWTAMAALRHLQAQPGIRATLSATDAGALLAQLPFAKDHRHPEGLFFPDTYFYRDGATDRSMLRQAHRRMREVLNEEWRSRDESLPYETPYQALILASIVEAETGLAAERGEIAGVFVRRLRSAMRLEADPAVIYGLGDGFDGDLRREHLNDRSNPYNTYQRFGLPPTPVALPGRAAIRSAMRPKDGDSLYFVAKGDGSHAFSSTLDEHRAAVRAYQFKPRRNYRSAPPARSAKAAER